MFRFGMELLKGLMNICTHDYTIIRRNSEEGDEPYPDGNTKIDVSHAEHRAKVDSEYIKINKQELPICPNQDESSGKGHKHTTKVNQ